MKKKFTEKQTVNEESNVPLKGNELSQIDRYILEQTRLLELRIANLLRFRGTINDATFVLKKLE